MPLSRFFLAAIVLVGAFASARAEDQLKLAVGQHGNWNTSVFEIGQQAGLFKKRGLVLEILYTSGSGETQQAVIAGSVDIGTSIGTSSAIAAFARGAPVRIIAAETTGAADYWYASTASGIKTLKDADNRSIGYSTAGSSSQAIVLSFKSLFNPTLRPVATGNAPSTLTQVMSGQVDMGWASPPFGLRQIEEGAIRIVARANDLPELKGQTIRILMMMAGTLERRHDAIMRFMQAYRETIDLMYGGDAGVFKTYAKMANVSEETARRVPAEFFSKPMLDPDRISGLDTTIREAIAQKFISKPPTEAELAQLIQIPPRQ